MKKPRHKKGDRVRVYWPTEPTKMEVGVPNPKLKGTTYAKGTVMYTEHYGKSISRLYQVSFDKPQTADGGWEFTHWNCRPEWLMLPKGPW